MSDADILLLTLEVEAAAARNANLSLALERVESQLRGRSGDMVDGNRNNGDRPRLGSSTVSSFLPITTSSVSTQTTRLYSEGDKAEIRHSLKRLNEVFHDVEECMAFLQPSEGVFMPGRRVRSDHPTIEKAVCEITSSVKDLRETCKARITSLEGDNIKLKKVVDAQRKQIKNDDLIHKEQMKSFEKKLLNLQARYDLLESKQTHFTKPDFSHMLSENEQLKVQNEALTSALTKLQHEITYAIPKSVNLGPQNF
ncbi:unnamed protein product [Phytomonas sp. Hart1]|nr:unnamed protein product [Phytomonas sp. Hart1]|eukprot:CCW70843.1 unnamed protein product [Phytomonas sp. isolate Hart1]